MDGWIKLHRIILDWEWYDDHNTTRLFLHLLMKANHKSAKWRGIDVDAGSLITGRKVLAFETGLSEQNVRTSLNRLKSTNELTIKKTNKCSIISINNWGKYQLDNQQSNPELTSIQPASNQQVTTNKNDKKKKNVRSSGFKKPTLGQITEYVSEYAKKKGAPQIDPETFYNFYESKNWMVGKNKMKDWKATIRGWFSRDTKRQESPALNPNQVSDNPSW